MITYQGVELTIGTRVFTIHKKYVEEKLNNRRLTVCNVKTFMHRDGAVVPVLVEIGNSKNEIIPGGNHNVYCDLKKAIEAIDYGERKLK